MLKTPQHKHDCDACVYLGSVVTGGGGPNVVDLYFHRSGPGDVTVISRYGENGDYTSGICFARPDCNAALYAAAMLAIERGLMSREEYNRHMTR